MDTRSNKDVGGNYGGMLGQEFTQAGKARWENGGFELGKSPGCVSDFSMATLIPGGKMINGDRMGDPTTKCIGQWVKRIKTFVRLVMIDGNLGSQRDFNIQRTKMMGRNHR